MFLNNKQERLYYRLYRLFHCWRSEDQGHVRQIPELCRWHLIKPNENNTDITKSDIRGSTLGSLFIIHPPFLIFNRNRIELDYIPSQTAMWPSLIMMSYSLCLDEREEKHKLHEEEKKYKNKIKRWDKTMWSEQHNNYAYAVWFLLSCWERAQIKGAHIQ